MLSMQNMKLLVVGSINMDIFTYVKNLPKPGETLISEQVQFGSGGKGANQAIAASLSGSEVYILGAVGNDAFRGTLLQSLKENNVNISYVMEKNMNSGLALITVDKNGENHIVLSEGANGSIKNWDVDKVFEHPILPAAVLVQNEITLETTRYVMEKARKLNIAVYYNAAPAKKIPEEVFGLIDVLILNELEATTLTGTIIEVDEDAKHALNQLINKGVKEVIITLGKKGSVYGNKEGERYLTTAYKVDTVDTTAAGDTFVGAYLTKRLKDRSVVEALKYATAAAAITVTRIGAQISIPTENEIEEFMK